jgi:hypothetical protein
MKINNVRSIIFIVTCFCFITSLSIFSQEHKEHINGHVFEIINNSLTPMPGVNVYYSGTTTGVITDVNGFF